MDKYSDKTIVVSFSGGRTSAYMCYKMLMEWPKQKFAFIFANTGKELEKTLEFVKNVDAHYSLNLVWLESIINQEKGVGVSYRVVDFDSANRNGEPFSDMVQKFGIPNKEFPHCTRELKERPIQKWADETFGAGNYITAIGMRADERRRMRASESKIYPLCTIWPTNEFMVRDFWARQNFDLGIKDYQGNCDLCWKKSRRKRLTLIAESPEIINDWAEWEAQSEYVFDREGYSIPELVEMSARPFRKALDKYELSMLAPEFSEIDMMCGIDVESSCTCE